MIENHRLVHRIVIPGILPQSWNTFWAGVHWSQRQAYADFIHLAVRAEIDPDDTTMYRDAVVVVTAYFAKNALDADNIASKPFVDALKGRRFLDDTPEHIRAVMTVSRLDKTNPRTEIEIWVPNHEGDAQ